MEDEKKWKTPRGKAATTAKNKHRDKNYDRMELFAPKGMKPAIEKAAKRLEYSSRNEFVLDAVKELYKKKTGEELECEKE